MTNKHIGSNFDDFLKEEGIEFDEQEFEKDINVPSKEIIIDGVDVKGCEYFKYGIDNCCRLYDTKCSTTSCQFLNCYYKQLKRAEKQLAEDEEIQVDMRIKIDELKGLLSREEQECEELNKELAKVYEYIKLSPLCYKCDEEECLRKEINQLKAENEELKNFHINLVGVKECEIRELVKYKQALKDIKNIAVGITSTFYKGVEISTTYEQLKQILRKCEVLDVR